ncbi:hypothetical protein [Thalassotalea sp. PS06]|uniref:hypothetical protein n=1 Tax=Thalassotalea sp. PS06 TaxID=2594005 RepID=UPI0011627F19|nr:hypothetical protein [Thalassotalea sp. PS06]QDP01193.1 hypothetical protein FNC98_07465 [Thalassotalea sp. PS06]
MRKVKQIQSRVSVSSAIFSFLSGQVPGKLHLQLFCAGANSHYVDVQDPLEQEDLMKLLTDLRYLNEANAKKALKIPVSFWSNIRITFSGYDAVKGFKVRAYITGFLFFSSSAFMRSYLTSVDLNRLIGNLERCID